MAVRGSSAWRREHWGPSCKPRLISVPLGADGAKVHVDYRLVDAVHALDEIFARFGYRIRKVDTGAYNCRAQKGSSATSSHAWAIAIDVNWQTNPYRKDHLVTDMPGPMIDAIEDLRTVSGHQVWRWGGDWDGRPDTPHNNYDAMHFELMVTPAELATGIAKPKEAPADMAPPRTIQIAGENSLWAVMPDGTVLHITSPLHFFLLAKEGAISGAKQRVVEAGSDDAKALREIRPAA